MKKQKENKKNQTSSPPKNKKPSIDYEALYLRALADLDNYKKRAIKEKSELIKTASIPLLESLFPIIDNMKLGLKASKQHTNPEELVKGFELVLEQFHQTIASQGVKTIEPQNGDAFDPNLHEALSYNNSKDIKEDHVIETIRTGYLFNDRLIRAANVIISSGTKNE